MPVCRDALGFSGTISRFLRITFGIIPIVWPWTQLIKRFSQILADSCRFLQILADSFRFFRILTASAIICTNWIKLTGNRGRFPQWTIISILFPLNNFYWFIGPRCHSFFFFFICPCLPLHPIFGLSRRKFFFFEILEWPVVNQHQVNSFAYRLSFWVRSFNRLTHRRFASCRYYILVEGFSFIQLCRGVDRHSRHLAPTRSDSPRFTEVHSMGLSDAIYNISRRKGMEGRNVTGSLFSLENLSVSQLTTVNKRRPIVSPRVQTMSIVCKWATNISPIFSTENLFSQKK